MTNFRSIVQQPAERRRQRHRPTADFCAPAGCRLITRRSDFQLTLQSVRRETLVVVVANGDCTSRRSVFVTLTELGPHTPRAGERETQTLALERPSWLEPFSGLARPTLVQTSALRRAAL